MPNTKVIETLKTLLTRIESDNEMQSIVEAREEVQAHYQNVFSQQGIENLTSSQFRDFLIFKNNHHWTGLQRLGPQITSDMAALREALLELIDEEVPIAKRMNSLLPEGKARVHKLGKAVLTPVLLITQPSKYSVWNGTSEAAMKESGLWPEFAWGSKIGERYDQLNKILLSLANELAIDLWTLDILWWRVLQSEGKNEAEFVSGNGGNEDEYGGENGVCGLERHLHDFLFDNWDQTSLGKDWALVEDGGDIKGYGYERPTDVGKIDLLARHTDDSRWLVIELKRGKTSDSTLGQVLRYMGWVKKHLAQEGEKVEGLIIGLQDDLKLRYAMDNVPSVRFLRYEVKFSLKE